MSNNNLKEVVEGAVAPSVDVALHLSAVAVPKTSWLIVRVD
jgi:hypothetical protein